MSGGKTARYGFAFQDLVLCQRILAYILARRAALIEGNTISIVHFGVEASPETGAPEWDLLQQDGKTFVLEEAKSGDISARDRRAFWRRVRSSIGHFGLSDISGVVLRLTVNAASLPSMVDHWRQLANRCEQMATAATFPEVPAAPPRQVRSVEDLVTEALCTLLAADSDGSASPLLVKDWLRLLSRFELNDSFSAASVEDEVDRLVASISQDMGIRELHDLLRGEVARRAESRDRQFYYFTVDDFVRSISLVERLLEVDPATLRHWKTFRNSCALVREASPPGSQGLAYQEWRALQPIAGQVLDTTGPIAVAIIGSGGIGKSVLMKHWLAEREAQGDSVLLLNARAISTLGADNITAALDLGRFAAQQKGLLFTVGIDALDSIGSAEQRAQVVAALHALVALEATVCVTCRGLEWRTMRTTSEPDPNWKAVELDEWPEERVRQLVDTSARPTMAGDIIRLLRTPLMLDILLRTFGTTEVVPTGLQTRHGLLQSYWGRRILPASNIRSAARRLQLDAVSKAEASGVHQHMMGGPAAQELMSEGLFIMPSEGLTIFRHALLRDFAMMQWLQTNAQDSRELAACVKTISPSLVRYGALRALLEALWSHNGWSSIPCASLLSELRPPMLYQAATVLGEFDCLQDIDLAEIAEAIVPQEREQFLVHVFSEARSALNAEWLHVLMRLPLESPGTSNVHWMTPHVVAQIVLICEALDASASHTFANDQPMCCALAARLRCWSTALCWDDSTRSVHQHTVGVLVRLLVRIDPSIATLQWASDIAGRSGHLAYWVLGQLSKLVRAILDRSFSPSDDELREVYLRAAGLFYDSSSLRESPQKDDLIFKAAHQRVDVLLGGHGRQGLIAIRPSAYVPIAVDLLAQCEASERANWETKRASWKIDGLPDLRPEVPAEIQRVEDLALAAAGTPLKPDFGLAGFEVYSSSYWGVNQDCDELLDRLQALAIASLKENTSFFDEVFWPAVGHSKSLAARACTLDLLTRDEPSPRPTILDELLKDTRLYFLLSTRYFLQHAISMRWQDLTPADRALVITNIRTCSRSPTGSIYRPGPLAGAIPKDERPSDLDIFIELYRVQGWSLKLEDPREPVARAVEPKTVTKTPWRDIAGLTAENQALWQQFESLESPHSARNTEKDWSALVASVTELVAAGLPSTMLLLDRSELVNRLANFCEVQTLDRQNGTITSWTSIDTLRRLALWATESMRQIVVSDDAEHCKPLDDTSAILPRSMEAWLRFAAVADWALWDPALREECELDRALYAAIAEGTKILPPRLAMNLLNDVHGWFRAAPFGKELLWDMLYNRIRNARVLEIAIHSLNRFSLSEQKCLMTRWLMEDSSPSIEPHDQFLRSCGVRIGHVALIQLENEDGANPYREILLDLLANSPTHGILSDPKSYLLLVGQSVFGAKEALTNGIVSIERAPAFVQQITRCWERLLPLLCEENVNRGPAFSLWVFSPVLDSDGSKYHKFSPSLEERLGWWRALIHVAKAIVRSGPWREVDDLMRLLAESPLISSLTPADALVLLVILNQRCSPAPEQATVLYHRDQAIAGAAGFAATVGMNAPTVLQNELHAILTGWSLPPISNEDAARAARQLRSNPEAENVYGQALR